MSDKELEKIESIEGVSKFLKNVIDLVEEVPFGNSDFQNRLAIVDGELSPHRAYRHAALRIIDRLKALNECYYDLRVRAVEIKKLERKLETETDPLERELIQIEIDRKKSEIPYIRKLVKDAIREVEVLYPVLEKIGKMTREEFESCEKDHFKKKLLNLLNGKNDAVLSLEAISQEKDLYDLILQNGKQLLKPEEPEKLNDGQRLNNSGLAKGNSVTKPEQQLSK
jgi:hypothetical protein